MAGYLKIVLKQENLDELIPTIIMNIDCYKKLDIYQVYIEIHSMEAYHNQPFKYNRLVTTCHRDNLEKNLEEHLKWLKQLEGDVVIILYNYSKAFFDKNDSMRILRKRIHTGETAFYKGINLYEDC